jgi:phosphomannomutase
VFIETLCVAQKYLASPNLELDLKTELAPIIIAAENGDATAISEIQDRFSESLTFGTGGLRGYMAAGLRRINKPNIRRATLALSNIAKKYVPNNNTALVGFDTRLKSQTFALETARVLAEAGYKVYLGKKPLPTPFLCYAMRKLGTACGVIITASHNPKDYNGYKAYNNLGGQVLAPWDKDIENIMSTLLQVPPPVSRNNDNKIMPIPKQLEEDYINLGLKLQQRPDMFTPAKILYTPFHGTGIAFVPELYRRAGLQLQICEAQAIQDGTFPTAPRPNPEEIMAYKVPLADAEHQGSEVIISNDPDADRIGLVAPNNGKWELMTGNDLVALTLDYLCCHSKRKGVLITTVVTSDFVAKVALYHGLEVVWTLTGFKYIALSMDNLIDSQENFVFGAEESSGMQLSNEMRDKDGVLAALFVGEMVGYYKALGMNPFDAVVKLQQKVGLFFSRLVNLEDNSPQGTLRFANSMNHIRQTMPTVFAGEKICMWEDFQIGKWYSNGQVGTIVDRQNSNFAKPIEQSNVLKLRLASGAFVAFRPSGTEPKLKVYLQSCTTTSFLDEMEAQAHNLLMGNQ